MTAASQVTAQAAPPPHKRRGPQWAERIWANWTERWPAVFGKPVPLAVGTGRQIKAALAVEGKALAPRTLGAALHYWTMQPAYLRAIARGETRRNLDGTEAGSPDDLARRHAQELLDRHAARRGNIG